MQDSNPQADGNAEARSHDEWRSDRSADTVLRDGARIPTPADGAGAASALEEGVWGGGGGGGGGAGGGGGGEGGGGKWGGPHDHRPVAPKLAQPQRLKTRH